MDNTTFEELVRDSERLETVKRYVKSTKYVDERIIKIILGIEDEPVKEGE